MSKFLILLTCLLACGTSFAQNSGKEKKLTVDTSALKNSSKVNQLKEVNIQAKKPFVEHRADKTIINVENSIIASGSTALEVLEKAPGIIVDRNSEQIRLNNKNGIIVMIDGKPNILSGADLNTMLSNMSSDQVATIEIITNPSSKYDAAGNAGIINIKLKRNKNYGTNGSVSSLVSQGIISGFPSDLYRTDLNLNLNHRAEKWNVFGNGTISRRASYNQITVVRTTLLEDLNSRFSQNFGRSNKGVGYMGRVGIDYYASPRTTFGILFDANKVDAKMNFLSNTIINEIRANEKVYSALEQVSGSNDPASNLTANFNIKHDLKEDASLTFDVDYLGFSSKKNEKFDTKYLNSAGQVDRNLFLRNGTDAQIDVFAARTDFAWPISKTSKLETGLKSSYVNTRNDFLAEQFENNIWKNDLSKSNQFKYEESINAAYLTVSQKWEKWEVQGGLRAEHTYSQGFSLTDQKQVNRNYISLFPTIFINQSLGENNNLRYSYGRRVDRPNYQQLNPFIFYLDPYTIDRGNPYLRPMFTDNFELSYSYKSAFSFALNYADTRDLIVQFTDQDDATRIISLNKSNIGRSQNYAAIVSFPLNLIKWWSMQNNISGFWRKVTDGDLLGSNYNRNNFGYNLNTSNSFKLPTNFSIEANFWLNSPSINGQEQGTRPRYALNIGAQKSLMNKKMKLRVNVDDVFLTNQFAGKVVHQNLDLRIQNRSTSRRASFNVSYSFGNQNVKSARARKTAGEDLKNRAN